LFSNSFDPYSSFIADHTYRYPKHTTPVYFNLQVQLFCTE
jgi:hypothetical protein